MKAAGSDAIFVAMSAVVNARHRLILKHGFDLMLAAAWITEDTVSTMGRESKFLRCAGIGVWPWPCFRRAHD